MSLINNNVFQIIANASNIRTGNNPEYTVEDFLLMYPQFGLKRVPDDIDSIQVVEIVPKYVLEAWLKIAHASIQSSRYHDLWEMVMGLYIAHFVTLYLQTTSTADMPLQKIIDAGLAKGLQSSKSAGDLSVSYDFNTVAKDFDGWGTYKQTAYGQQLISIARIVGMGGMVVW